MTTESSLSLDLTTRNTTNNETYFDVLSHPVYRTVIYSLTFAYSLVFLCALFGNLMVVLVVYRNASMHNATNYFIVNLAIADILVALFCVPLTLLDNLYPGWPFGPVLCKVTPYLQGVSVCASVNTLAAIAVDRYLAICRSFEFKLTARKIKHIIIIIWILSMSIMTPWAVFYTTLDYKDSSGQIIPMCYPMWPSPKAMKAYFIGATLLSCYIIPLILIIVCYLFIGVKVWRRDQPGAKNASACVIYKSKVKVVKMLAVVVIMFAFSWMPLYVVNFVKIISPQDSSKASSYPDYLENIIIPIAQWLGSSNSGMNPIIYCFFSKKFRYGFRDLLTCFKHRHVLHDSSTRTYMCVKSHIDDISSSPISKRSASPRPGSTSPRPLGHRIVYNSRV
ncbi:neuropeptide SIFamide receptor-like [Mytilus trossulus]|uniref:neuropeptide SIFamide receptor-like n=1 Tax=Mytilus trossulus TaxID=6551 RepID=UPI003005FBDE